MPGNFRKRAILFTTVLLIHGVAILGPAGKYLLDKDRKKLREIAFKVDIGSLEPSHAPEVGEPEKLRPGNPNPPPPPEPEPQPEPPKPEPKPQVKPKPQQKTNPKPQVKPKPQQKTNPKPQVKPKTQQKTKPKTPVKPKTPRNNSGVYSDPNASKFDPNKTYGRNTNPNVRIGSRDAGQKKGQVDGKTPAGGKNARDEKAWEEFYGTLQGVIKDKWDRPAGIWISEETAAVIAIRVNGRGQVIDKKIHKSSPNHAVNTSAAQLLRKLNELPPPPGGQTTEWLLIRLVADD